MPQSDVDDDSAGVEFTRFRSVSAAAGQVRFLAFVSFLLAVWQSFQIQFFITIPTFAWLSLHHLSSPLSLIVTFLRRGSFAALIVISLALVADLILFFSSLLAVLRCFNPVTAAENCPTRLLQGGWMILFSAQHSIITIFELLSMRTYNSLLQESREEWSAALQGASKEKARRLTRDAENRRLRRSAGVRRRLAIFSLVPGITYWIFASPFSEGWLAAVAGTKVLKDLYSIWSSQREADPKSKITRKTFSVVATVLSGVYLFLSLSAWMWSEETADLSDFTMDSLWDGAKSAFDDPFNWMRETLRQGMTADVAPFLLLFALVEGLSISTANTPLRVN